MSFEWEAKILNLIYETNYFNLLLPIESNNFSYFYLFKIYLEFINEKDILNLDDVSTIVKYKYKRIKTIPQNNYSKEEQYQIDLLIKKLDKIVYNKIKSIFETINALEKDFLQKKLFFIEDSYSFFDVIVFSAMSRCTVWQGLYKDLKSSKKKKESLFIKWFQGFIKFFDKDIDYIHHPSLLTKKHKKILSKTIANKKANPQFINCIRNSNYEETRKMLLKNIKNLESIDPKENHMKATHIACENGDIKMCRLLDEFKCNWEDEDVEKMSPLFYAIYSANFEVLDFLIEEKKVNIEHCEFQQRSPFYWGCCLGNLEIVKYLYSKNLNINSQSILKRTALSKCSYLGRHQIVEFLLNQKEINIDLEDNKGRTALHNAAWGHKGGKTGKKIGGIIAFDSPESAELLLKYGANVNKKDFEGCTPLYSGTTSDALKTIPILIKYGADLEILNNEGETPLFGACRYGHVDTVQLLIEEFNANFLHKNFEGIDCFEVSILNERYNVYQYLLKKKIETKKFNIIEDFYIVLKNFNDNLFDFFHNKIDFNKYLIFYFESIDKYNINFEYDSKYCLFLDKISEEMLIEIIKRSKENLTLENKKEITFFFIEKYQRNKLDSIEKIDKNFFEQIVFNSNFILEKVLNKNELNSDFFNYFLSNFHYNLFDFCKKESKNTIFHYLVYQRKLEIIIFLINIFLGKVAVRNKFLMNLDITYLKEYFLIKNQYNFTALELSLILKYLDIHHILESFYIDYLKNEKMFSFHIPEYEIEIIEEIIEKNNEIIELINNCNFLENLKIIDIKYLEFLKKFENLNKKEQAIVLENEFQKPYLLINNLELLGELISYIKNSDINIFGIDTEFHVDKNPELSFVCTIQISSFEKDFIIDTFYLHNYIEENLKFFFEDEKYLKLFHGGDHDFKFLKHDFNISVINLFDTSKGHMLLTKNKFSASLSQLTEIYLNFPADKSFQSSEWRIRPLPQGMQDYARLDARYLLYIFPLMMKEIENQNLLGDLSLLCF